jgi:hypothetical protein
MKEGEENNTKQNLQHDYNPAKYGGGTLVWCSGFKVFCF